jgi:hypothetical protein
MKEEPAYLDATEEELATAHAIFYSAWKFGSTELRKLNNKNLSDEEKEEAFKHVYNLASWYVTGKAYDELTAPMRSEISHLHGLGSDFRFRNPPDTVGPSLWPQIEAEIKQESVAELLRDWEKSFASRRSLRDTLHPEDEAVLLEDVPRFLAGQESVWYRRSQKRR